jgi:hypothetical protein
MGIQLALVIAHPGRNLRFSAGEMPMAFRIERLLGKENTTVLRVYRRVDIECLNTLKELIEAGKPQNCSRPFRSDACGSRRSIVCIL